MLNLRLFFTNPLLAASLSQALGQGLGIVLGIGFLAACASLVAAALGGFGERSIAGIKVSLVLAIVCGLAYVIVSAIFQAGGIGQNIQVQAIN